MTDDEDENALIARLEKSLAATRRSAELVRSGGVAEIVSGMAGAETELRRLVAACDALRIGIERQQGAIASIGAAVATSVDERQRLRQALEALASKMQQPAAAAAPAPVPQPPPTPPEAKPEPKQAATRIGTMLIVLVLMLGSGIAGWLLAGSQSMFEMLVRRLEMQVSSLIGLNLAERGIPAAPARTEAQAVPRPVPQTAQPLAPAEQAASQPPALAPQPPAHAATTVPTTVAENQAPATPVPPAATVAVVPPPAEAPSTAATASAAVPSTATSSSTERPAAAAPPSSATSVDTTSPPPATTPPREAQATAEATSLASAAPVVGQSPNQPSAAHQLVLRATAETWVWVRQDDGPTLLRRLLKTGETWNVPATPHLILDTGNARGLVLEIDGLPVRLGSTKDDVVRGVQLDSQSNDRGMVQAIDGAGVPPMVPRGSADR